MINAAPLLTFDHLPLDGHVKSVIDLTCDFTGIDIEEYQRPAANLALKDVVLLASIAKDLYEEADFGLYIDNVATATINFSQEIEVVRSLVIRGLIDIGLPSGARVSSDVYLGRLSQMARHFQ